MSENNSHCERVLVRAKQSIFDIILITGDAYVDHPSYGSAVIRRVLESKGFKVGIIAQPDWRSVNDFKKLGRPRLFFGITSGNVDSMVANYTSNKKPRRDDDYSPGGKAGMRPDRALIVYANRLREAFDKVPIVIGGIEASLRRLAHYDYWADEVRRSVLLDSRADILVYGMGETQIVEIAQALNNGESVDSINNIRGTVVVRKEISFLKDHVEIPSFEEVKADKNRFNEAFRLTYQYQSPGAAKTLVQKTQNRFVIQFPPAMPLTAKELDDIYELPYTRLADPVYKNERIPGFEAVKFSIISNRGCCGECAFCSLYFHQGRIVQSRSAASILNEISRIAQMKDFKGTITDIGGPTANLYKASCGMWQTGNFCKGKSCLIPQKCKNLKLGYDESIQLLRKARQLAKVKHIFIGSGFRYDLLSDNYADAYLKELCSHHVSGYMKVAPEHKSESVLKLMRKTDFKLYERFVDKFKALNKQLGKKQFLVNYFITAHPGASAKEAKELASYLSSRGIHPEQIQDFIPLPMTLSAAMYWTGKDPLTGEVVFVPKSYQERRSQRALLQSRTKR